MSPGAHGTEEALQVSGLSHLSSQECPLPQAGALPGLSGEAVPHPEGYIFHRGGRLHLPPTQTPAEDGAEGVGEQLDLHPGPACLGKEESRVPLAPAHLCPHPGPARQLDFQGPIEPSSAFWNSLRSSPRPCHALADALAYAFMQCSARTYCMPGTGDPATNKTNKSNHPVELASDRILKLPNKLTRECVTEMLSPRT